MATAASQTTLRSVLGLQPFRRLWTGQLVSIFGDFLAIFAVYNLVSFRMHGTPAQVTMVMISFLLPFAFLSSLAGVFVDRWNVKRTMIASDLTRAALALVLVLTRSPLQIYGIFLALSTVSSFFFPAQSVTLRTIVPKEGLLAANALMQQALQVMRIFSPALAGALVTWFGEKSCFYLDSFSFLFSALMIAGIRIDRQAAPGAQTVQSILADLTSGIKFIFTHSAISFVMISMTAGTFAISCFSALVAIYVRDVLSSTSVLFGIVSSLVGLGMIAGTQVLSRFARNRSKNHLVAGGLLGNGVAIFLLAAIPKVTITCLATFVLGFSVAFIIVPAQTLLQQETSVEMLGRVSGSLTSAIAFAQLLALAFAGSIANLIGIRNLYYVSAAMLLGIATAGYWKLAGGSRLERS